MGITHLLLQGQRRDTITGSLETKPFIRTHAIICRGTRQDFEQLVEYIKRATDIELIFIRSSTMNLYVSEKPPGAGSQ